MENQVVTVIGGAGFVGRHLVHLLAAEGYRIRVLVRDTIAAEFLKTQATPGQIALEYADITRPETFAGKFAGSQAVVNLAGIFYESGRQTFERLHIECARAVALEAKRAGVPVLVHLSALGVDSAGGTRYGSSKLAGEKAMRLVFPDAIALRPSLIVGPEDGFFQRFGRMRLISPILPLIAGGKTRFQPVLVTDVARAIAAAIRTPEARGRTYELAGPQTYSLRGLLERMADITRRKTFFVSIPAPLAAFIGRICEALPFPPLLTRDQVKLLAHDNVLTPAALTFAQLGITPASIEDGLGHYLDRFIKV